MEKIGKHHLCDFVFDGQEAVSRFSELYNKGESVDYFITDFMMPRLNGMQAISKIKNFVASMQANGNPVKEPKFVFLTSYKTSAFDKLCGELNVQEVFEKPIDIDVLQDLLMS